ncbi:SRPBCC domain-containing protein [Actinocrispum wychmicini]|uniref:Uncharacterized protein YndB with AHSA1/START domain n=1 Tax=Actinocrispum wychmicini TaxID=1213861 RepID=A0A4R2IPG6_9PSEU|nr:SRPBCC domain-containing protein [Actinocrispum wychmicini]TCO46492.1 uncharacterized protein YndB with AHSA1/START domain [Actinocrispum wychmicini]
MLELTEVPSVKMGLLIRRPPAEVFRAMVDPEFTTKVWYSKSSGEMTPGAKLVWEWEVYGASAQVTVLDVEKDSLVRFTWGNYAPDNPTTVEFRFIPLHDGTTTYFQITETGFTGTGDELVRAVADSTGGYTYMICALKALLEHDLVLNVVPDVFPAELRDK